MAVYPCSFAPHRYASRQRAAYISDVSSARPETRKHRLCPVHFYAVAEICESNLTLVKDDTQPSPECQVCGGIRTVVLFVKLYAENGEEPAQYAGDLCVSCKQELLRALEWRYTLPIGA